MTFELGTILMTPGIRDMIGSSEKAYDTVVDCLRRHTQSDWGGAPATGHKHCQMWHWITTEIQLPICLT